ncbi:hypothetical protein F01_500070 [Burkholderia cenocepacia]|nr:hypothetical protein F01_500070 [Burkholderia cenocepacia]
MVRPVSSASTSSVQPFCFLSSFRRIVMGRQVSFEKPIVTHDTKCHSVYRVSRVTGETAADGVAGPVHSGGEHGGNAEFDEGSAGRAGGTASGQRGGRQRLVRAAKARADVPDLVRRRPRLGPGRADHLPRGCGRHVLHAAARARLRRDLGREPAARQRGSRRRRWRRHSEPGQPVPYVDLSRAPGRELHHPYAPGACRGAVDARAAARRVAHGRLPAVRRLRVPEGLAGRAGRQRGGRDHLEGARRQARDPAVASRAARGRQDDRGGMHPRAADRTRGKTATARDVGRRDQAGAAGPGA